MGQVTNEQVNLMLRLYEERREPKLREARDWFGANFHVKNADDLTRVCLPAARKTLHAHGARLLGDGGEHRKPRADR